MASPSHSKTTANNKFKDFTLANAVIPAAIGEN